MSWIDKLERKIGKYYIRNLMWIIVIGSTATFLINEFINPGFNTMLSLIPYKVMQGEVWRLITFVFVMPMALIFAVFVLYFYYMMGTSLDYEWGGFKFNLYYFIGMIATIVVSLVTKFPATGLALNLSIFLAYAKLYPDMEILIYFILPIKIKYAAYLTLAFILYSAGKNLVYGSIGGAVIALVPLVNYLLFFMKTNYKSVKTKKASVIRMKDYKKKVAKNKAYAHKCAVCGITDKDDPNMEFRYCSKCSGKKAYCEKHIFNHEHK